MKVVRAFPQDPTIWQVESESRPGHHYVVELLNFDGFGECTCEHFQCRIGPGLRDSFHEEPCHHIKAAKLALADSILERMIQIEVEKASRPG